MLRDHVRSRRARWATGGITLARHRPGGRSAASQAASLTSVWRPGPALTCGAWPHKTSHVPASRWHTGVPSSPVRSRATGVQPPPSSQSERPHRATGIVLKVRLSCPSGVTTHATTVFLCTSKPAQRSGMLGITTAAQRDHGAPGVPAWSDPDGRAQRPPWAVPAGTPGPTGGQARGHPCVKRPQGQPQSRSCTTCSCVVVTSGHDDWWRIV